MSLLASIRRHMAKSPAAPEIIALAKELDLEGFKAKVEDNKQHIARMEADGIHYSPVMQGDQVTLAAQSILLQHTDDPRAVELLGDFGC